jgi:hypothetical protein
VPDGSLCSASVEQIFPRDGVQRNCFEFALYIMTASPTASVRNYPRRRCPHATFGARPTLSVRDRAIIVLNDHRFWGYASGPSSSGNTLPSSIHGHAARRSALPRERFSPLTQQRHWLRRRHALVNLLQRNPTPKESANSSMLPTGTRVIPATLRPKSCRRARKILRGSAGSHQPPL